MFSQRKHFPDYIIFILLLIIGIKLSYHSGNITDIDPFDESIYLYRGTVLNPFIKHHLDGFLYYFWYKILSLFTTDNFELFFLNNSILLVLPGLLLFSFLRVMRVNIFPAFIAALLFMFSSANIFVIPLITKFAISVILFGFMFIYKIQKPCEKLLGAVLLAFILLYIRPEFILTLSVLSVLFILYVLRQSKGNPKLRLSLKIFPLVLMIIIIIFFNPVSRHRANISFMQHYSRDILERETGAIQNLDQITRPDEIMRRDFSTDYSMSKAFINNPPLFLEHMGYNFYRTLEHIEDALPYFLSEKRDTVPKEMLFVISILLLILTCYFILARIKKKKFGVFDLIFILFSLPPFISVLIFYPRSLYDFHYSISADLFKL
ncbi:MAG: hypothetical protein IPM38_17025 [Ignavibacteria bacterium]|nr:hypothetical protein [Ignavibacteria bacterium]